jgi:LPS export ABC transporter permease LptF
MPVLIRYYLMALWPPFFLAIGCVLFILNLLFYLNEFLNYLFLYQAGVINSFRLLLYFQPSLLVLAVPIGFLIALLVVYGRLSADREVVAVESCGFSPMVLIWPMIILSCLLSVFLVFFMDKILPWGNISYLKLDYQIATERTAIVVREGTFIKDFDGYILYVKEKDDKRDILKDVTVWFLNEQKMPCRLIHAKQGIIQQNKDNFHVMLDLSDGIMQQLGGPRKEAKNEFYQMQFRNCDLDLSANKLKNGPGEFRDARNISIKELALRIKEEKNVHADTRYDEVEYYKKFSIPFSALAFAFIGVPLGLVFRTGSIAGPFLAIILVAIYDGFIIFGQDGGPRGIISPLFAAWLPDFVLTILGLVMVYWLNHRLDFWGSLFRKKGTNKPDSTTDLSKEMDSK